MIKYVLTLPTTQSYEVQSLKQYSLALSSLQQSCPEYLSGGVREETHF